MPLPAKLDDCTAALGRGERLSADEVRTLVEGVLAGGVDLDAFGRWLVALADAGETAAEITGVAAALRGLGARSGGADRNRKDRATTRWIPIPLLG